MFTIIYKPLIAVYVRWFSARYIRHLADPTVAASKMSAESTAEEEDKYTYYECKYHIYICLTI